MDRFQIAAYSLLRPGQQQIQHQLRDGQARFWSRLRVLARGVSPRESLLRISPLHTQPSRDPDPRGATASAEARWGLTSRLLDSRASVAVFDARAPRREGAKKLVWAARFPRASYPTVCGQKFRARRRSRRQKSSFSARLLRQPLTVERRSHAMGRPPQNDRALPDRALGHSLCYWRRFW